MDLIVASSRGEGLEADLKKLHPSPQNVQVIFKSSATLQKISKLATDFMTNTTLAPETIHIYVIGGYCNLNEVLNSKMSVNGRGATYQEFVFREDPESAVTRLTGLLQSTADKIAELNALPVLCTIPPSDLATWNRVRLSQRKTCMLTHEHKYEHMQYNLITTLVDINKSIASINISRNMQTPRLADTMMKKKGRGGVTKQDWTGWWTGFTRRRV